MREARPAVPERPSSRSTLLKFTRASCSAGPAPTTMPSRIAGASVTASTTPSRLISCARGRSVKPIHSIALRLRKPRPMPRLAPISVSSVASVISCLAMRRPPAPIALRVASSFIRPLARTSDRLAMLTAAISTTNTTPPHSICSAERTLRTRSLFQGAELGVVPGVSQRFGERAGALDVALVLCGRAATAPARLDTPAASRPIISWFWLQRRSSASSSGGKASGVNTRTSGLRKLKASGSTPTTRVDLVVEAEGLCRRCRRGRRAAWPRKRG